METNLIKIEDAELEISHTVDDKFELIIVKDSKDLELAKENIVDIQTKKKIYTDRVAPIKSKFHTVHKKICEAEKENEIIYNSKIIKQKTEIDAYNKVLYEKQQALEKRERKRLTTIARWNERKRKIEARKEVLRLQEEQAEIDDSWDNWELGSISPESDSISEKSEQLENDIKLTKQAAEIDLPIEIETVDMFSAKNRVKPKDSYSIGDEEAYIEWAIKNERALIKIEPVLSVFNRWVKMGANSNRPFIKTDVGYK